MIELRCPACKQSIKLDESFGGRRVACIGCGKDFALPDLPQRPADKTPRSRSADRKSPAMSVVMPAKPEPTLLDTAKRHRDKIVGGLVVAMLGIAALVLYSSMRGGGDEAVGDNVVASTNGENDPPTEPRENPTDTGQGRQTTDQYDPRRLAKIGPTKRRDEPGNTKVNPTPQQNGPSRPPMKNGEPQDNGKPPKNISPDPPPEVRPVVPAVSSAGYASSQGVLLRHSSELNDWITVSRDTDVPAGSRIAVPSPFAAHLDVGQTMYAMRVVGGTLLQLLEPAEEAPFGVELQRGRLIITGERDSDAPGAVLTLAVRDERWRVELLTGNTVFGVEILPRRPQRYQQNFGEDNFTGGLLVVKGSIRVTDKLQRTRVIAGNSFLSLAKGDRLGVPSDDTDQSSGQLPEPQFRAMPDWLDLDRLAADPKENPDAELFESLFNRQQPFAEAIGELLAAAEGRAVLLAVECQSLLGQRINLIKALASSRHAEVRRAAVAGLREQMPATKQDRDLFKKELKAAFDKGADAIYTLLWGYADEEIRKNQFTCFQLVAWLTHEELVVRELVWAQITAHATARYAYKPDAALRFRRVTAKKWQQHVLKTGTILGDEVR